MQSKVTVQNGNGKNNGTDKLVLTDWCTDKMLMDQMVRTKWLKFYIDFNSSKFNQINFPLVSSQVSREAINQSSKQASNQRYPNCQHCIQFILIIKSHKQVINASGETGLILETELIQNQNYCQYERD